MKKYNLFALVAILCLSACKSDIDSCFTTAKDGLKATFSGSCSIDAVQYDWEFGDGGTSIAESPTHTYASGGTYTVTLRVSDKKGRTSTTSETITVVNPVTTYSGPFNLIESCGMSGVHGPYTVTLTPVPTAENEVMFDGLYVGTPLDVTAVFSTALSFTIARQPIQPGYDLACSSGTITADGDSINMVYEIYQSGSPAYLDQCTAILAK